VDSPGAGLGPVSGSCEHGDEPLDSGSTELVICDINVVLSTLVEVYLRV
jgi:hypothetical protein